VCGVVFQVRADARRSAGIVSSCVLLFSRLPVSFCLPDAYDPALGGLRRKLPETRSLANRFTMREARLSSTATVRWHLLGCLRAGRVDGGQPTAGVPALEEGRRQAPEQAPLGGRLLGSRALVRTDTVCDVNQGWRGSRDGEASLPPAAHDAGALWGACLMVRALGRDGVKCRNPGEVGCHDAVHHCVAYATTAGTRTDCVQCACTGRHAAACRASRELWRGSAARRDTTGQLSAAYAQLLAAQSWSSPWRVCARTKPRWVT